MIDLLVCGEDEILTQPFVLDLMHAGLSVLLVEELLFLDEGGIGLCPQYSQ